MMTGSKELRINWQGPSTRGNVFPSEAKLQVILQGLYGLVAYIENAKTEDLENWNMAPRNPLAHNGIFLEAVFGNTEGGEYYENKKGNVNAMRKDFRDREATLVLYENLEQGLQAVKDALQAKDLHVTAALNTCALTELLRV
jgi:hypothetical protein